MEFSIPSGYASSSAVTLTKADTRIAVGRSCRQSPVSGRSASAGWWKWYLPLQGDSGHGRCLHEDQAIRGDVADSVSRESRHGIAADIDFSVARDHRLAAELAFVWEAGFCVSRSAVAVFVDGCFWHGCPRHYSAPANNADFWSRKRIQNGNRDRLVSRTLRKLGWKVVRIWEHDLKGKAGSVAFRIARAIGTA